MCSSCTTPQPVVLVGRSGEHWAQVEVILPDGSAWEHNQMLLLDGVQVAAMMRPSQSTLAKQLKTQRTNCECSNSCGTEE